MGQLDLLPNYFSKITSQTSMYELERPFHFLPIDFELSSLAWYQS